MLGAKLAHPKGRTNPLAFVAQDASTDARKDKQRSPLLRRNILFLQTLGSSLEKRSVCGRCGKSGSAAGQTLLEIGEFPEDF